VLAIPRLRIACKQAPTPRVMTELKPVRFYIRACCIWINTLARTGGGEDDADDPERTRVEMATQCVDQHLHADEHEDYREPELQIAEELHHSVERK